MSDVPYGEFRLWLLATDTDEFFGSAKVEHVGCDAKNHPADTAKQGRFAWPPVDLHSVTIAELNAVCAQHMADHHQAGQPSAG